MTPAVTIKYHSLYLLTRFQYRHVFTDGPKKGSQYTNITISAASGDHQAIKCNTKFFATGVKGGGGPVLVVPLSRPGGAILDGYPKLNGHTSDVSDCDFNPFNEHLLVLSSSAVVVVHARAHSYALKHNNI